MADGDGAGFGFSCADHEHVGNFLHLRVADFGWELFVAVVEMDTDAVALESFGYVLRVFGGLFADRPHFDFHGSEPEPERSAAVLSANTNQPLASPHHR